VPNTRDRVWDFIFMQLFLEFDHSVFGKTITVGLAGVWAQHFT